jgi:hypothetical protein
MISLVNEELKQVPIRISEPIITLPDKEQVISILVNVSFVIFILVLVYYVFSGSVKRPDIIPDIPEPDPVLPYNSL